MTTHTAREAVDLMARHFGTELVTVAKINARLAELGYELDRNMDCRAPSRWMTGALAGTSYPCCTTGIRERDTGRSFANCEARRDGNFRKLQALRGTIVALSRGAVLEI